MKCAACSHRWVPGEELDEDEAVAAVQEEARAASVPAPVPMAADSDPGAEAEPPPPPQPTASWVKTLVAGVVGAALATAAAGLWAGRAGPGSLPGLGDVLARTAAPAPRLNVQVEGRVTRLPGGASLIEVTGTIHNPGAAAAAVPPLNASLLVNGTPMRSWTIPAPAPSVGAGKMLVFVSSLTDVPQGGPVTVQVRFGR